MMENCSTSGLHQLKVLLYGKYSYTDLLVLQSPSSMRYGNKHISHLHLRDSTPHPSFTTGSRSIFIIGEDFEKSAPFNLGFQRRLSIIFNENLDLPSRTSPRTPSCRFGPGRRPTCHGFAQCREALITSMTFVPGEESYTAIDVATRRSSRRNYTTPVRLDTNALTEARSFLVWLHHYTISLHCEPHS